MTDSSGITNFVVEMILGKARSDFQFERFCVKHWRTVEGLQYVLTSSNNDSGRDARAEWVIDDRGTSYICASCDAIKRVPKKAETDLNALLAKDPQPGRMDTL